MDDDFLYEIRPSVRPEFADALYQRLSSQYPDGPVRVKPAFSMAPSRARSRWAWQAPLLAILVLTALTISLSQPVRARALAWIRWFAGFAVEERTVSPLKRLEAASTSQNNLLEPSRPAATHSLQSLPASGGPTIVSTLPVQTLPEALAQPPFPFGLPAWTPAGYTLNAEVAIANTQDWVILVWNNPADSEIMLLVEREYTGYNIPAGEGSSREAQVDGQPALWIEGIWDAQHEWDPRRGLALYWLQGGRGYRLVYSEREPVHNELKPVEADRQAVMDDLTRMAESIP